MKNRRKTAAEKQTSTPAAGWKTFEAIKAFSESPLVYEIFKYAIDNMYVRKFFIWHLI